MLRSAIVSTRRVVLASPRCVSVHRRTATQGITTQMMASSISRQHHHRVVVTGCRFLSSESKQGGDPKQNKDTTTDKTPDDENAIVLTPGEQVVAVSRLTMWAGVAVFAAVCAYYIGRELIPTKMSPNMVFSRAVDSVREHNDVKNRFGTPIRAYGRDHGGKRVGRRNFIEHTEYKSEEDGSKRTRVRFNLDGPHGQAFVFAEVSSDMPSGEFVYLIVQDKANGRVITIVDNRASLAIGRMTAGSQEGKDAMTKLLTGGK